MKITVIIATYQAEYKKILMTLESVINQKFTDYEVIITDDASTIDYFDAIKKYFIEKKFFNYKLIKNSTNIGTVKNVLGALEKSKGKYIKCLGAGDLLFNKYTLKKIYNYLNNNQYKMAFGIMEAFHIDKHNYVKKHDFIYSAPKLSNLYQKKKLNKINHKRILYSLIFRYDTIFGASMFFEKEYFKRYLKIIAGKIRYMEDLIRVLVLLDNERIYFMNKKIIWYEFGSGISTKQTIKNQKLLDTDRNEFMKLIGNRYKNNAVVRKAIKYINSDKEPFIKHIEEFIEVQLKPFFRFNKNLCDNNQKGFLDEQRFLSKFNFKN